MLLWVWLKSKYNSERRTLTLLANRKYLEQKHLIAETFILSYVVSQEIHSKKVESIECLIHDAGKENYIFCAAALPLFTPLT